MGRSLGLRHAARVSTGMTMAALLCLTGTPVVQSFTNTADNQARPRARVTPGLVSGLPRVAVAGRSLPWLTTAEPEVSRAAAAGGRDKNPGQQVTGPKGSRVWVPSLLTDTGIPYAASQAYHHAADVTNQVDPACHIPWTLLAAIGRVESDHGQYGGAVLDSQGISHPTILGVPLNGRGDVAAIPDTDNGTLDHDTVWDRAVGPMQFLPSTWRMWARDGDGNGVMNPNDINDAAMAAAAYLCASGNDVAVPAQMRVAIYSYNQSAYYVALVMAFQRGYQTGVFVLPPPPPPATQHKAHKKHAKPAHHQQHRARHHSRHRSGNVVQAEGSMSTRPSPTHSSSPSGTSSTTTKPSSSTSTATKPSGTTSTSSSPTGSPTSSSPSPTPSTSTSPTPSSSSSPTPSTSSSPTPTLTSVSGTLESCGTGWCLDSTPLDVGSATVLAGPAGDDYDGDGTVETRAEELSGLVGSEVTLLVVQGSASDTVYVINGMDYRYGDGTFV